MVFKIKSIMIINIILFLGLMSCQPINYNQKYTSPQNSSQPIPKKDLRSQNIKAVDEMLNNCNIILDRNRAVIVTSLVKVDNLTESSTFGRMSAEIIANRLAQLGYNVKEVKLNQSNIYIKKQQGEFVLSRELKEVANNYNVQGIVVGTYALVKSGFNNEDVCICLRIIEPVTNRIGCSKCYSIEGYSKHSWQ